MGNSQTLTPSSTVTFNRNNVNSIPSYGYPYYSGKFSIEHKSQDAEVSSCLQNVVNMFDNQIDITHRDNIIIDPIVIRDKANIYKLFRLEHDFHHVPEPDKYCSYRLEVNDKQTYKFNHISNVQLYFETINGRFAKY